MKILAFKEKIKATKPDFQIVWTMLKVIRKMKRTFLKMPNENIPVHVSLKCSTLSKQMIRVKYDFCISYTISTFQMKHFHVQILHQVGTKPKCAEF